MPRLTPAGPRRHAEDRTGRLGFGVPAYAHPLMALAEWAELARPGSPLHWVSLDPGYAPGSCRDPLYAAAVARLRDRSVPVLGRLDVRYGTRPFPDLIADAHRYLEWYAVDGFHLDRAPVGPAALPECRQLISALRALLGRDDGGTGHLVLGHGRHPYPGYAEAADQLVTFSGPWREYRWSEAPQWTAAYPPERFCHLVHGVPKPHLEAAMRIARWQGASTVFFTDRTDGRDRADGPVGTDRREKRIGTDPWEGLPGYWDEAAEMLWNQPPPSR